MLQHKPDVFDRSALAESLRRQGCPEYFIAPVIRDFRLLIPLVLRQLGEQRLFEMIEEARDEMGFGPQQPAGQTAARYIVGWAEDETARLPLAKWLARAGLPLANDSIVSVTRADGTMVFQHRRVKMNPPGQSAGTWLLIDHGGQCDYEQGIS